MGFQVKRMSILELADLDPAKVDRFPIEVLDDNEQTVGILVSAKKFEMVRQRMGIATCQSVIDILCAPEDDRRPRILRAAAPLGYTKKTERPLLAVHSDTKINAPANGNGHKKHRR